VRERQIHMRGARLEIEETGGYSAPQHVRRRQSEAGQGDNPRSWLALSGGACYGIEHVCDGSSSCELLFRWGGAVQSKHSAVLRKIDEPEC